MKKPRRSGKFVRELNETKLSAALFQGAVHVLENLGENAHHLEDRTRAVKGFFDEKGYTFQEACQLLVAVEFRMRALLQLKDQHGLLDWPIPDNGPSSDTDDPYLAAAAVEPLIAQGFNDVIFDPERFRARLAGAQPS